jgi:hypothetical protein
MWSRSFAAVLVVLATGCGGSGFAEQLTASCVKDGGMTEAQCKCFADRAEKDLSKNAQALMLAEMNENQEQVQELSKKMTMEDAQKVGVFMMTAAQQCTAGEAN